MYVCLFADLPLFPPPALQLSSLASVRSGSHTLPAKIEVAVSQVPKAHSLTSALHYLVPVRPRRQIVYPLEKLGINAPSKEVSKDAVGSRRQQAGHGASAAGRGRWGGAGTGAWGGSFIPEPGLPAAPALRWCLRGEPGAGRRGGPCDAPLHLRTSGAGVSLPASLWALPPCCKAYAPSLKLSLHDLRTGIWLH